MIKFSLLLVVIFAGCGSARWSEDLKVRVEEGRILGRYMTSDSGRTIRAFLGVPYAEPPVGDLRFRSPVKKQLWHGVLKAHKNPPICIQENIFINSSSIEGQEDCLYLNVYAPKVDKKSKSKLPVMVNIHGGGWFAGDGGYDSFPPEYLLDHDVIFVSGNYRLGILGFLSFEDKECPGNFGLKDQAMMLQWVSMNIEKFGGDSRKITILGNSAGGASVNYHMVAPKSKGLFQYAISQSGSISNFWSDPPRPGVAKIRAIRLAEKVGCPIINTNFKEMTNCLRKVKAKKLTEKLREFFEFGIDPIITFQPVIEDFHQEDEAFISSYHFSKHSFDIPWLVGLISEEGLIRTAAFFHKQGKKLLDDLLKNWNEVLPFAFYYDHLSDDDQKKFTARLTEFYMKNEPYDLFKRDNLTNLYGDAYFTGMIDNLEYRLADNTRDNTFVYMFSHKGAASYSEIGFETENEKFYGTAHCDDLLYLYPQSKTDSAFYTSIPSDEDRKLSKLMVEIWVNFAKTGKPTPVWTKESEYPYWPSARAFPLDYMTIGNMNGNRKELFSMDKGLLTERHEFWKKLRSDFPKWSEFTFDGDNERLQRVNDEF